MFLPIQWFSHGVVRCSEILALIQKKCKEGKEATYAEAMEMCMAMGMRLCTKDELDGGVCCGTGGKCDDARIWTTTTDCSRRLAVTKVGNATGGAITKTQGITKSASST